MNLDTFFLIKADVFSTAEYSSSSLGTLSTPQQPRYPLEIRIWIAFDKSTVGSLPSSLKEKVLK